MATLIDGRGNVTKIQTETETETEMESVPEEFVPMDIEEYRNLNLTAEQEWNNVHNPKRCSIEALRDIEIKARGAGPDKKLYNPYDIGEGPFFDPQCNHLHIWKSYKNIKNFIGEQDQTVPHVQFTDIKPGSHCCICHKRNIPLKLNWTYNLEAEKQICKLIKTNLNYFNKIIYTEPKPEQEICTSVKKNDLTIEKVIYNITPFKSLYLYPWELTPYQRFKLKMPDYKKSMIFLKSDLERFATNYACIV
jgi:hypothetical protein